MYEKKLEPQSYVLTVRRVLKKIHEHFETCHSLAEIEQDFAKIEEIGRNWREYFAYKGIYRIARKHFLREVAYALRKMSSFELEKISSRLAKAIIYTAGQGYLPVDYSLFWLLQTLVELGIERGDFSFDLQFDDCAYRSCRWIVTETCFDY